MHVCVCTIRTTLDKAISLPSIVVTVFTIFQLFVYFKFKLLYIQSYDYLDKIGCHIAQKMQPVVEAPRKEFSFTGIYIKCKKNFPAN